MTDDNKQGPVDGAGARRHVPFVAKDERTGLDLRPRLRPRRARRQLADHLPDVLQRHHQVGRPCLAGGRPMPVRITPMARWPKLRASDASRRSIGLSTAPRSLRARAQTCRPAAARQRCAAGKLGACPV